MKKIVSVLLCLVMAMSLCTVAFATDCNHMDQHFKYVSNGNGTHKVICEDCNEVVDGSDAAPCYYGENDEKNACTMCNGKKPVECDHMGNHWLYESNGNGTHDVICDDCDKHVSPNMPCKYVNGKCITCGFVCKHGDTDMWSYIRVDETYHKTVCKVCDTVVNANVKHEFVNGKCVCGAVECKHEGAQKLVPNEDGKTHNAYCAKCNKLMDENVPHTYQYDNPNHEGKTNPNGEYCYCGAQKPACNHEGAQKLVANKDGKTHNAYCPTCDKLMSENIPHSYEYADAAAKNHVGKETGKYCLCGAEKPTTPACKHEGAQKLVPNKDKKTHNAYCPVCNELMAEKIPHTYQYNKKGEFVGKGGAYCLCGAKKSTSSAGSNTGSTTTTTTTTKSPKTGDMGVVLYAATALLSLSGTAVVIKKRKNDK